ncbi:OmpA family protein [Rhodobaculum claviforme]|uniref:Peptidoglycan-associated lipoprotein n=1 Tax=Rhodobaculum claviforme TaxID=1549854 RepID=A0A934TLT9_9RHOB|nr:OmpA family protein [Rhodobaculum claviforme]MBK5928180.1 peptidoglycan-associated lipoprotein [Rhodobaculum claviforme]
MSRLLRALMIVALTAGVAACSNPNRFGAGGGMGDTGAFDDSFGRTGIDVAALGDPNDPTSRAFFEQRIGDRVFFTTDQSTLSETARDTLRAQTRWLTDNRGYGIVIEGHADERGTREYNLALSERRANAVREFLVAQGIAPGRIRTVGYGKERPVEACPEARCWDVNRRAVTLVTVGAGA